MSESTTKNKFHHKCEKCNFETYKAAEWLIHIETAKHKRDGKAKSKTCETCNIEFATHWLQKMHNLKTHATKEERSKHKYYCNICDYIFFSKLYLDKHTNGIVHKNLAKALDSIKS